MSYHYGRRNRPSIAPLIAEIVPLLKSFDNGTEWVGDVYKHYDQQGLFKNPSGESVEIKVNDDGSYQLAAQSVSGAYIPGRLPWSRAAKDATAEVIAAKIIEKVLPKYREAVVEAKAVEVAKAKAEDTRLKVLAELVAPLGELAEVNQYGAAKADLDFPTSAGNVLAELSVYSGQTTELRLRYLTPAQMTVVLAALKNI